jgi:hypothetical protein
VIILETMRPRDLKILTIGLHGKKDSRMKFDYFANAACSARAMTAIDRFVRRAVKKKAVKDCGCGSLKIAIDAPNGAAARSIYVNCECGRQGGQRYDVKMVKGTLEWPAY